MNANIISSPRIRHSRSSWRQAFIYSSTTSAGTRPVPYTLAARPSPFNSRQHTPFATWLYDNVVVLQF